MFKDVVGFEGFYQVSDNGIVKSLDRIIKYKDNRGFLKKGKIVSVYTDRIGRKWVHLQKGGKTFNKKISCLIAEAFIGPRPYNNVVRHLDGNPANNTLANLAYGTQKENIQDALRHGTMRGWFESKFSDHEIIDIRADRRPIGVIAKEYKVSDATIINFKLGKRLNTRKHLLSSPVYYKRKILKTLSDEDFKFVLDKNNSRADIAKKLGISVNQVKKIRHTKKPIFEIYEFR